VCLGLSKLGFPKSPALWQMPSKEGEFSSIFLFLVLFFRLKRMPAFTPKAVKTYDELSWPMKLNYNYNLYWYQFLSYPFVRGMNITFMGKEIKILEAKMNKSMYEALIKGHYAEKKAAR